MTPSTKHGTKPLIREATFDDAKYLIEAGRKFCKKAGLRFNEHDCADTVFGYFTDDRVKIFVRGKPAKGHCIVMVIDGIYDRGETTARVISTWGKGGIKCFHHALRWAKENKIELFCADSLLEERLEEVYKRSGMSKADVLYVTRLNNGH